MLPLDIRREIASIRGKNGFNWHSSAFQRIQEFADQLLISPASPPATTPATSLASNGGSSAQTPQFIFEVNGAAIAKANLTVLPPPATGRMSVEWLLDSTIPVPNVSGGVRNSGGVDARVTVTETISLASQGMLVTLNNAGAVTVTLDSTVPSTFLCGVLNMGTGTATLTPSSGNINGVATLVLTTLQGTFIFFDGTNWWAIPEPDNDTVINFADAESPTDSGDHQHFTLAHSPTPTASLQLFVKQTSGQFFFPGGVDYTLTGANIALTAALVGAFTMLAYYRY